MKTIRQRVRVLPGGRIEITDPSLQEGAEAEVTVSVPEGDGAAPVSSEDDPSDTGVLSTEELLALPPLPFDQVVGSAPSGRTAEEIDRDLRALRDEWDEPFARREQEDS